MPLQDSCKNLVIAFSGTEYEEYAILIVPLQRIIIKI